MPISRKNILTAGFGALSLMAAVAMAQEQVQRYQANKPVVGNTNAAINSTNYTDSQFAGVLIVDNQGEIALGKLAEQKSGNKDIKQFAQMMVKDHTDFMQQLEKFARTQGQNAYSGANMPQATGIQQQASGNTDQACRRDDAAHGWTEFEFCAAQARNRSKDFANDPARFGTKERQ